MAENESGLDIHCGNVAALLEEFIRKETGKAGRCRVVVGLSGGIDSAVSASLAVRALGAGNVLCVLMPYRTSSPESLTDAGRVIGELGADSISVEITAMVDAYFSKFSDADLVRRGNKMARERMSILYDLSSVHSALVLGTSNKTELLLGYGTLHGDMASALNPLGDLYKTQVRQLAGFLQVPDTILNKPPSADLWPGQSDEGELGVTYETADRILHLMVDRRADRDTIIAAGFPAELVDRLRDRVRAFQFKRRPPLIAKLSARTVGIDFRYPRDWGH
jgi:NAD+ synthase